MDLVERWYTLLITAQCDNDDVDDESVCDEWSIRLCLGKTDRILKV